MDSSGEGTVVYYLKLIFSNEDAAYYQFPIFPDDPLLASSARKREGAIQHLRMELFSRDDFQILTERWRGNPHLIAIKESSEEEFHAAPSHAI